MRSRDRSKEDPKYMFKKYDVYVDGTNISVWSDVRVGTTELFLNISRKYHLVLNKK